MPSSIDHELASLRQSVFAKTAAGNGELLQRSALLNGRQRSLLILIDGKRDFAALEAMVLGQPLEEALSVLRALGLIAPQPGREARVVAPAVAPAAVAAPAPVVAPVPVAPPPVPPQFEPVKALMISSAESCLGPMAGTLVQRIVAASDEKQLRVVMGHWHMAMRDSKFGKAQIGRLHSEVTALLAGNAAVAA